MPRPKDLVKGLLIPVAYVVGLLSTGDASGTSILRAAVVWAVVELLVYPARYQWNDVRGFVADQRHPSGGSRGRLPGPLSRARSRVLTSCSVAGAKLIGAAVLVYALPNFHLAGILTFAIVGVWSVAVVYEVLKSTSTGRTGQVPTPVTAGIASLWLVVGAGYVVRGLVGMALAVDLTARSDLAAAAAITLWAYGIAFVTSRWALEVTAFAETDDGRITWQVEPGQAREHLLALVRWLPSAMDTGENPKDWAPLRGRTAATAPWNVAMVVAGAAAAVTGRLLCGPCSPVQAVVFAIGGAAATYPVIAAVRWRAAAVLAGAAFLLAVLVVVGSPTPALGAVPWLLVLGAYLYFSSRTRASLDNPSPVRRALNSCAATLGRLILGRSTYAAIHGG